MTNSLYLAATATLLGAALAFLGACWGLRTLFRSPQALALPPSMMGSLSPTIASALVGFLLGTLFMLLLAAAGVALAWALGYSLLSTQGPSLALGALLVFSALGLIVVSVGSRWFSPMKVVRVWMVLQAALASVVIGLGVFSSLGWALTVFSGPSMLPSLPGLLSIGIVDTRAYRVQNPVAGDIVTFQGEEGWHQGAYNKRVVGLPGDRFTHALDQVWKNGRPLVSCQSQACRLTLDDQRSFPVLGFAFAVPRGAERSNLQRVPDEHLFVLGDNLPVSGDSRDFGPVPASAIEGKVVAVIGWRGIRMVQ